MTWTKTSSAIKALICGIGLSLIGACASPPEGGRLTPVAAAPERDRSLFILVSIDGFRADYLQRGYAPNLKALADSGATAVMRPSYPSLTFPNHNTIVTGLRPDHHGVVNNTMIDAQRPGVEFKLSNREQVDDRFWWDGATPFWVSAERAGLKTSVDWPGAGADIQGVKGTFRNSYDHDLPGFSRVDRLLGRLDLPADQRPQAATLYFDQVDTTGHNYGPDAPELNSAVSEVDAAIGRLVEGLRARGLGGKVNLIVVADHGMTAVSPSRAIYLEDLLKPEAYKLVNAGTMLGLIPNAGHEAEVDKALIETPNPHMTCWHKGKIPERLHYGTHPRIPEIVCMPELGYIVGVERAKGIGYKGGAHGYDPAEPDMAALFIANGPDIRKGVKLPSFDNVSVYSLIMTLTRQKPLANDGNPADIAPALKP